MRSSAVGPDRLSIALPLLPPEAANLYTCHEVVGATACQPDTEAGQARCLFWVNRVILFVGRLLPVFPWNGHRQGRSPCLKGANR